MTEHMQFGWRPDQLRDYETFLAAATSPDCATPIEVFDADAPWPHHPDCSPKGFAPLADLSELTPEQLKILRGDTAEKDDDQMTDNKPDNVTDFAAAKRERDGDGSYDNPYRWTSAEVLAEILDDMNVFLRFNIRSRQIEFREDGENWEPATDRATADLRERISKRYWHKARTQPEKSQLRFGRERWGDYLNALAFHEERDPFLEWLDDLPQWDGIERIEHILVDLFEATDSDLTRWASRAPFVGAVQRARHPGSKIDESPVLISEEQGLGKSGLVRAMVPPEYVDQWHGDSLDLSASKKEQSEALSGRVVVEIAELDGLRRAEIESVKAFLIRTNDGQFRPAYGRGIEKSPRRCVFVGTSNSLTCLANDPSGNRRLVPVILLKGTNVEEAADRSRDQWWAEAIHLQAAGDDGRLPRALIPEQRDRAEQHRSRDEHLEDLVMALPNKEPMTITQLHDEIDNKMKTIVSDHRLGSALRSNGWVKSRLRENGKLRYVWTPPEA